MQLVTSPVYMLVYFPPREPKSSAAMVRITTRTDYIPSVFNTAMERDIATFPFRKREDYSVLRVENYAEPTSPATILRFQ